MKKQKLSKIHFFQNSIDAYSFKVLRDECIIEGDFGVANKLGKGYWEFTPLEDVESVEDFREWLTAYWFTDDVYNWKGKDVAEADVYHERVDECETWDDVVNLVREWDKLVPGWYDSDDELVVSDAQLNDKDFVGYDDGIEKTRFAFRIKYEGVY